MSQNLTAVETYTLHLAAEDAPTVDLAVRFADQAAEAFVAYRDEYGFGASGMKSRCGNIYDSAKKLVARVSYNGRVWDTAGNPAVLA